MAVGDAPAGSFGQFAAPAGSLVTGSLSNRGNPTAFGEDNTFRVLDQNQIRLVDNSGKVLFSGYGADAANQAVALGQSISDAEGNKAGWTIQVGERTINPDGSVGPTRFYDVANEKVNKSTLSIIGDVIGTALPIAVNFIPGLQGFGSVLANAVAGAGGAAISGEDPLKGAIMGGLTSAGTQFLGPVVQSAPNALGQTVATNLGRAVGAAAGATAGGVATGRSIENSLLGGAIAGGSTYLGGELFGPKNLASDDLVTKNINMALSGLENGLIDVGAYGGDLLSAAYKGQGAFNPDGTQVTNWPGGKAPSYTNTTMAGDTIVTADLLGGAATSGGAGYNPAITVTGTGANATNTKADTTKNNDGPPITVTGTGTDTANAKTDTTKNNDGTIVVTGKQDQTKFDSDGTYKGDLTYIPSLLDDLVQQEQNGDTKDKDKKVTDTIKDALTYASGAGTIYELIKSLFGGGGSGGDGTGTPYVSPFGAGPAIGGADFRVNPNIQNYEQYGFGPEATFFRPEYNKLVSSGASMGGSPIGGTATTNTPTYTPLIGGPTTGDTTTTGGATTGGTTATTKQERPAGFTGVVSGQQVGDTQVVDGTTWSYGGDQAGWQMQYTDPTTGNLALLPGNGATNVSSFKNNPTVSVNQPYFAQNTANIPGWATTYQGFQQGLMGAGVTGDRKAAAERELFSAIETQPFANATALVDFAKNIYNKYTGPSLI